MDVLTTAYIAAGRPHTSRDLSGPCGRCGTDSDHLTSTAGRRVISEKFTAFDGWHNPSSSTGLCPPCTWSLTAPELRQHAHLISNDPEPRLEQLTRSQLHQHLEQPLGHRSALIVPLRPGRKYLLPDATWGQITTDDAHIPWTHHDVERLQALRRLREHGFGSRMLTASAPPWRVFRALPQHQWPHVLTDWDQLEPWRSRPPWLALAIHATADQKRSTPA